MASKYWIKLYHEILHDPKMGTMPDKLWRRTIELFLMTGELDKDGELPPVEEICWILRISPDECNETLQELQRLNVAHCNDDSVWFITHFSKRQAANTSTERSTAFRERKRQETQRKPLRKATETQRNVAPDTDTDTESNGVGKKPTVEIKTSFNGQGPLSQLMSEFLTYSGIPIPDNKSDVKYWWSRVGALYEIALRDVDVGRKLIRDSIDKLRKEELTISDPGSLVKTARSLMAKPKVKITAI